MVDLLSLLKTIFEFIFLSLCRFQQEIISYHLHNRYPHYDKDPSFKDFQVFGGWSKPSIKQFAGDETSCGIDVDYNYYPSGEQGTITHLRHNHSRQTVYRVLSHVAISKVKLFFRFTRLQELETMAAKTSFIPRQGGLPCLPLPRFSAYPGLAIRSASHVPWSHPYSRRLV